MALDWQKIEVPFGAGGLGESTDPHQLPPARLVTAENVEIVQAGRLDRRKGTTARSAARPNIDTLISTPDRVIEVASDDRAYREGLYIGRIPRMHVTTERISSRQDHSVASADVAAFESGGHRALVYAYIADGGVYLADKDPDSNAWRLSGAFVASAEGVGHVRTARVGDTVCILWISSSGDLKMLSYKPAGVQLGSTVTIESGVELYDVSEYDEAHLVLAYRKGVSGPLHIQKRAPNGSVINAASIGTYARAVGVMTDSGRVAISWIARGMDATGGSLPTRVFTALINSAWDWELPATELWEQSEPAFSHYSVNRISPAWLSSERWITAWACEAKLESNGVEMHAEPVIRTYTRSCNDAGSTGSLSSVPHILLSSKCWTIEGRVYAVTSAVRRMPYGTTSDDRFADEAALLLVEIGHNQRPLLVSTYARDVATYVDRTGSGVDGHIPGVGILQADGINTTHVPYLARRTPFDFASDGVTWRHVHWLESAAIRRQSRDFGALPQGGAVEWTPQGDTIGGATYLAGALPLQFDGARVVEHGFAMRPMIIKPFGGVTYGEAGNIEDGEYKYIAVYVWRNALGQVEFSTPSTPFGVTVESGKGTVGFFVRPLPLTHKSGIEAALSGSAVTIAVYRTLKNDASGIYYLVSDPISFTGPNRTIRNDVDGTFHHFADSLSDETVRQNPVVYTSGGVLENEVTGPTSQVITAKGRLWALDANGRSIWYSKPVEAHEVPGFSGMQRIPVETDEPLTAIESLDDRIVAFTRNRAFFVYGEGPNRQGLGGAFSEPREATIEAGCIGPNALARTSHGIAYIGPSGIYLMSRGGQTAEIGRDVRDTMLASGSYWMARHMTGRNQVRFWGAQDGYSQSLVWDYEHGGQWTTHRYETTLRSPAVMPGGALFAAMKEPGSILEESSVTYLDEGQWVGITLETGHIQLDGLQGYQRVRDVFLLAKAEGSPGYKVTLSLAADDGPFYGSAELSGADITSARGTQARVTVGRQLCRAIRIKITDRRDEFWRPPARGGPSYLGLAFHVGLLRGPTRLGTSAKRGVK